MVETSPPLPLDALREKKGMPDGVRRGLTMLERDLPGLVATTDGGTPVAAHCAVRFVLLLLWLDVRVRRNGGI